MTIRKSYRGTNTRILLFALLSLLVIRCIYYEILKKALFRAGDQLCKITGSFRRTGRFFG